jgi:hypothetical protein
MEVKRGTYISLSEKATEILRELIAGDDIAGVSFENAHGSGVHVQVVREPEEGVYDRRRYYLSPSNTYYEVDEEGRAL